MMDRQQLQIIQKIIDLKGSCLSASICKSCPLRTDCLPSFLTSKNNTAQKRLNAALTIITNFILINDLDLINRFD